MKSMITEPGTCNACGKESEYTCVCCSACGAISYRYCLNCLNGGIEPYGALIGMGLPYESITIEFRNRILDPSLKFHNKTIEQFNADVKKLNDDYINYMNMKQREDDFT